jgi:sec-independent protein translocase protein TatA
MNIFGIGLPEMAVIAAIGLLVFGPKRLPELGKTLGRTLRGFQSASQEFEKEFRMAITPDDGSGVVAAQALPAQESLAPAPAVATTNPTSLSVPGESAEVLSADQPHG